MADTMLSEQQARQLFCLVNEATVSSMICHIFWRILGRKGFWAGKLLNLFLRVPGFRLIHDTGQLSTSAAIWWLVVMICPVIFN